MRIVLVGLLAAVGLAADAPAQRAEQTTRVCFDLSPVEFVGQRLWIDRPTFQGIGTLEPLPPMR